ncbi:glycosyltransferase [Pseudomonas muyukensis]|uniref:Glycosyltransferase n=1 Tax=Pseudomonas muyukensis TaxID=2842357 RepID=A0ABX8MFS3_9PSED|nr:glycosyltransferase [Pseudomonas muyukensis]QXH37106.1 glycosyltransferase [Pseudomonas muyukensis]
MTLDVSLSGPGNAGKKVVHLSTNDFGGAGSAALRFHRSLLGAGYASQMYVAESKAPCASVLPVVSQVLMVRAKRLARRLLPKKLFARVRSVVSERAIFSAQRKYLYFSVGESSERGLNPELVAKITEADVLFVHWVAGFVNTFDVLQIQKRTGCKVYYTSMDMAHLTGGCHYYWQCEGYRTDCSDCPALDQRHKNYAAYQMRAKSLNILQMGATLLSCSQRIHQAGQASAIPYADYAVLPLPLDSELFTPAPGGAGRQQFRFMTNAHDAGDPRKGFEYLQQVLVLLEQQLAEHESIELLCLDPERLRSLGLERVKLARFDFCHGDAALAALYKQLDLFVSTSIEDAGPMMVGEALMCGVPVVAFDVGIAPEVVKDGANGYIVDRLDVRHMAARILELYRSRGDGLDKPAVIHEDASRVFGQRNWNTRVAELISAGQ